MVSRDWAVQHIHECIVGSPCRFWLALNLGLHAIELMAGKRREDGMAALACKRKRAANSAAQVREEMHRRGL